MDTMTARELISSHFFEEQAKALISYFDYERGGLLECGITLDDTEISYENNEAQKAVIDECDRKLEDYLGHDDEISWGEIAHSLIIDNIQDSVIRDQVSYYFDYEQFRHDKMIEVFTTPEGYMFYQ